MDLVWYYVVFDFLIADKQTAACERHGIEGGTSGINQPRYQVDQGVFKGDAY